MVTGNFKSTDKRAGYKASSVLIFMLCAVLMLTFTACGSKTEDEGATPTATVAPTDAPTSAPTPTAQPTATPTQKPTAEPVPTIEPGKETYAGDIVSDNPVFYNLSPDESDGSLADVRISDNIAMQFFATVSFSAINVNCVSYSDNIGTIVFNLYKWQGSYDATIDSEKNPAVYTYTAENFNDNSVIRLDTGGLPDGEYLIHLYTPNEFEQVGIYARRDRTVAKTRLYSDDFEMEGYGAFMGLHYTKTPTVMFGPLQNP